MWLAHLAGAADSATVVPAPGTRQDARRHGGTDRNEVGLMQALRHTRRRPVRASGAATTDAGMTTAEYAVGTVAACGFGGILYKLLTSDTVRAMLKDIIERALSLGF